MVVAIRQAASDVGAEEARQYLPFANRLVQALARESQRLRVHVGVVNAISRLVKKSCDSTNATSEFEQRPALRWSRSWASLMLGQRGSNCVLARHLVARAPPGERGSRGERSVRGPSSARDLAPGDSFPAAAGECRRSGGLAGRPRAF